MKRLSVLIIVFIALAFPMKAQLNSNLLSQVAISPLGASSNGLNAMMNQTYKLDISTLSTGVKSPQAKPLDIKLFPNPATNIINLSIETMEHQELIVKICSIEGVVLRSYIWKKEKTAQIDISNLSVGEYFLTILSPQNNILKTLKFNKI